jgi:hypothetical protein
MTFKQELFKAVSKQLDDRERDLKHDLAEIEEIRQTLGARRRGRPRKVSGNGRRTRHQETVLS